MLLSINPSGTEQVLTVIIWTASTPVKHRLVSEISPAGKVMESWHIQFEKAE
jgi:hypothetical protein